MRRIKLWIQYDGTDYAGWQVQENATGIQNVIEEALFVLTGERIRLTGAGRTDKGVHALGQVAHFDTNSRIPGDKWHYQLKPILPDAIRVIGSAETDLSFHARFSAQKKTVSLYNLYRSHSPAHVQTFYRACKPAGYRSHGRRHPALFG
jgi:tRNA pseudouridine38-40 synthase